MVAWNTQLFIFGWCENFLVGISSDYYFRSRKERKETQRKKCGFELNNHFLVCATLSHGRFICF
jgi:hypothetical protein